MTMRKSAGYRHYPASIAGFADRQALPDPIIAVALDYPKGHAVAEHRHERAQMLFAAQGVMRISTRTTSWIVPPLRAIWIPAGVDHDFHASTRVELRSLYVRPELVAGLPANCTTVEVSPLLRELVLRLVDIYELTDRKTDYASLTTLVLGELADLKALPLSLPLPSDRRLQKICRSLLADPADNRTCAAWGLEVGASARTLERHFVDETGLTFSAWRRQARILFALTELASGKRVATVAYDLGYSSPSAFTTMFRKCFGCRPSEYQS